MSLLEYTHGNPDGLFWGGGKARDAALTPPADHWLYEYATAVCAKMNFALFKTKGRGHEKRFEVAFDLFELLLPYFNIHPPTGVADAGHRKRKKGKVVKMQFGNVRCALEVHRETLADALLAAGYDMERGRLVCEPSYLVAKAHWHLNHAPMAGELLAQQLTAVRRKLLALDRAEDAHLFRNLQS